MLLSRLKKTDKLQQGVRNLIKWSDANNMHLSLDKCNIVSYYKNNKPIFYSYNINNKPLQRISPVKDLGITMTFDLTFRAHVDNICNKASQLIGFICRVSRDFTGPKMITILYKTLVRSILEYCVMMWFPNYVLSINRLEKLQNKVIKIIGYKLAIELIDYLRSLITYHNPRYNQRRPNLFNIPYARTNYVFHNPIYHMMRLANCSQD
ncbi:hypothetical protein J437_LFUL013640, partial [Ladona fulva]